MNRILVISGIAVFLTFGFVSATDLTFSFMKHEGANLRRSNNVETIASVADDMSCLRECLVKGHRTEYSYDSSTKVCSCHLDTFFLLPVTDVSATTASYNDLYYSLADNRDFNDHNYILVKEPKTWADANTDCSGRTGYRLMAIETTDEQDWLAMQLRDAVDIKLWTSGNDQTTDGTWVWDLTATPAVTLNHWQAGSAPQDNGNLDCMHIAVSNPGSNLQWYESDCTDTNMFICEST